MKKFFKLGKRMLALFIVVLLNINSYAAVGANDGSAFVTKAEFDALVNTFNEQMDTYTSGLNSKIDGAIANYLGGLSSVQIKNIDNICYTNNADGILSVISYDNVQWYDGMMSMNLDYCSTYTSASGTIQTRGVRIVGSSKGKTEFTEIGLIELDRNNRFGVWNGICQTYQNFAIVGKNVYDLPAEVTSGGTMYIQPNLGFIERTGIKLIPDIIADGSVLISIGTSSSASTAGQVIHFPSGGCAATREIVKRNNTKIINVKKNQEFKLFSNFDKVDAWCNDSDNKGNHTKIGGFADIMNDGTGKYWANMSTGYGNIGSWNFSCKMGNFWASSVDANKKVRPYFGFLPNLTNWDSVLIADYDSYISDMKKYQSNIQVKKTKDDGNEHLYVSSGSPIAFVEKDATVTIPIEFVDKTKDYDLWVKVGAFDITKEITEDNTDYILYSGIQIKNKADEGSFVNSREGTASYSIRVESGYGEIKFKMPKDGYIFLKWSFSGNSAAGGGSYKPTKTIQVVTE